MPACPLVASQPIDGCPNTRAPPISRQRCLGSFFSFGFCKCFLLLSWFSCGSGPVPPPEFFAYCLQRLILLLPSVSPPFPCRLCVLDTALIISTNSHMYCCEQVSHPLWTSIFLRVCWGCVCVCSAAQSRPTPWVVVHQAPLSVEFSKQEYGVGCHFLLQWIFLTQG